MDESAKYINNNENIIETNNYFYPFNIFISYKISGMDNVINDIVSFLTEGYEDKLHIYASTSMKLGPWREDIHRELVKADLLILIYLDKGDNYDWCFYEVGYFLAGKSTEQTMKNIIIVRSENDPVPNPVEGWKGVNLNATEIKSLINAIYNDERKPVWEKVSDPNKMKARNEKIERCSDYILEKLAPIIRKTLSPKLYVTINHQQFEDIENGKIPGDIILRGESDAFEALGLDVDKPISLNVFRNVPEYKEPLDYFLPHLLQYMLKVKNNRTNRGLIPPIRLVGNHAKNLVPTSISKKMDYKTGFPQEYVFEFVINEPDASFDTETGKTSDYEQLCNFLFLAQHFQWRVINRWINKFENIDSSQNRTEEQVLSLYSSFKLDFLRLKLDSHNRLLNYPNQIEKLFLKQNDKQFIEKTIGADGTWYNLEKNLFESINNINIKQTVTILKEMEIINREYTILIIKRIECYFFGSSEK